MKILQNIDGLILQTLFYLETVFENENSAIN